MSTIADVAKPQKLQQGNPASVEIFPGIKSTPGVCGGDPCVGNTRITVYGLELELKINSGCNDRRELLDAYPGLSQDDLNNAWEYARLHADEIEHQIAENNRDDD